MANSDERPDILSLRPRLHGDLPGTRRGTPWARLRVAYVSAVAALFELIDPRHELYFVARDGEPFYDVARLATRNDPERARRLHLRTSPTISRRKAFPPAATLCSSTSASAERSRTRSSPPFRGRRGREFICR